MAGSIGFDRAAEYYDRTRTMSPHARAATIRMLAAELRGRGAVLEVGVGTGQIALELHAEGLPMIGVDISAPMVAKLLEKTGGGAPFPLALADGAALPFRAASFGAVVMRHVLHLVPSYADVIDEVLRVLRPGGVALTSAGWHSAVGDELDAIERSLYSWTWRLSDDERAGIADEIRRWAASRGVAPGDVLDPMVETRWRAYDAPRPA